MITFPDKQSEIALIEEPDRRYPIKDIHFIREVQKIDDQLFPKQESFTIFLDKIPELIQQLRSFPLLGIKVLFWFNKGDKYPYYVNIMGKLFSSTINSDPYNEYPDISDNEFLLNPEGYATMLGESNNFVTKTGYNCCVQWFGILGFSWQKYIRIDCYIEIPKKHLLYNIWDNNLLKELKLSTRTLTFCSNTAYNNPYWNDTYDKSIRYMHIHFPDKGKDYSKVGRRGIALGEEITENLSAKNIQNKIIEFIQKSCKQEDEDVQRRIQ